MSVRRASPGSADRSARKPTLRTVAEATGFAVTTVSRALADDPRISRATRDTIAAAARRLGYMPDRAARRLRTGRTQVVALLLNTEHEFLGFTHEFLAGITTGLAGTGYAVSVVPDALDGDRLEPVRHIIRNRLADGLIFTRTECFDPRARLLLEAGLPFVTHGRTDFTTPHPWVDYDNAAFARTAVRRLVRLGRRRVAIVLPDGRFTFAQHLRHGFLSAVREAGIEPVLPAGLTLDTPIAQIGDGLRALMSGAAPPDGHVCVGEATALTTLAALQDTGARLGADVDVIAKRASPIFDAVRPRIASAFEDVRAMGAATAEMLLRSVDGEAAGGLNRLFAPEPGFDDASDQPTQA